MNPIDDFTATGRIMSGLLDRLADQDMAKPTPCTGWSVAELANHIVDNAHFFAGAAGATPPESTSSITADNAVELYSEATDAVLTAYQADNTLDRDLTTPFGSFPGAMVLSVAFADQLTHCWDLARSINAPVDADAALVDSALATWTAFIQSDYRNGDMFGEAQTHGPEASNLDRLAAFTGRQI